MKNIFGSNLCQAYSLKNCGKSTTWDVAPSYYVASLQPEEDKLVYELYGLTEEEIRIVEGE